MSVLGWMNHQFSSIRTIFFDNVCLLLKTTFLWESTNNINNIGDMAKKLKEPKNKQMWTGLVYLHDAKLQHSTFFYKL